MRGIIAALFLCLMCGCIQPVQEAPQRRGPFGNDTVSEKTITLVSIDNCLFCDRQKDVISRMDLGEWNIQEVNHSDDIDARSKFPASRYPTLYIKGVKYEGFHTERQLRRLLDE